AGGYTSTTQVAISATPTSGYQFSSWSATNCTLANPNQASTTCTMTGGAAVVNANFNQIGGVQACASYSISPTTVNPGASAGSQTVIVTGAPAGCLFGEWGTGWNDSWLTAPINGSGPFIGSATVSVSWTANTGAARSGTATIAGNTFMVNQAPVTPACTSYTLNPASVNSSASAGNQTVTVTGAPGGCIPDGGASTNDSWVTVSSSQSGSITDSWTEN